MDARGAGRGGSSPARVRYALVLSHEEAAGRAIAAGVIERPRLSLWILFVPVLLVDYVQRQRLHQAGVEKFAHELLHARRIALDAALAAVERGLDKAQALGARALAPAPGRPGDAAAAQREEIELLFDHYALLLRAEGENYEALLRSAYGTAARHADFVGRLRLAERKTVAAVRRSLDAAGDVAELAARTEQAVEAVRRQEAERAFS